MAGIFTERFETTFGRLGVLEIIDLILMHLSRIDYFGKSLARRPRRAYSCSRCLG